MAESKFIRFQDSNGDRLVDVCDEFIPAPEEKICLDCKPNPLAIVTDWKNRRSRSIEFNEKRCTYELPYQTFERGTISDDTDSADDMFEKYKEKAVLAFFVSGDKKQNPEDLELVRNSIEFTSFNIPARGISFLKLLYSLPFDVYESLEADDDEQDDEDEGPNKVVFNADEFDIIMMRVRKGLHLYSRYQKAAQFQGQGLVFSETGKPLQLDRYGDFAGLSQRGSKKLKAAIDDIKSFLRDKGYTMSSAALFRDKVETIKFVFTSEYELKKISIKTRTCKEKWINFTRNGKLKPLLEMYEGDISATPNIPINYFSDPTAMAYIANAKDMEQSLTARSPMPWVDFITTYTYPDVVANSKFLGNNEQGGGTTLASCVADNLLNEAKEFGQDIFDEAFGLFEATALAFRESVCFMDEEQRQAKLRQLGLADEQLGGQTASLSDAFDVRSATQFAKVHLQDSFRNEHYLFESFCEILFGLEPQRGHLDIINELYKNLNTVKLCGLLDFLFEAIQCLFRGLSLEEALAKMCKAALQAMSLENLDKLFIGLPPDKQREIAQVVQQKLEQGQLDGLITNADQLQTLDSIDEARRGRSLPVPPFSGESRGNSENPENKTIDSYGNFAQGNKDSNPLTERTLAQQYDGKTLAGYDQDQAENLLALWFEAILEVYADDLLGLTDFLNRFPGAQLIANIIAVIDCPRPPIFDPSLLDFLNSIHIPFCKNNNPIVLPKLVNPLELLPDIKDLVKLLVQALIAEIKNLIIRIILKLLKKICEIIGNAICKALELAGNLAVAAFSRESFRDLVNESICGGAADDQLATNAIVDMMERYGADAAALADTERLDQFIGDVGAVLTSNELSQAFLGDATEEGMNTMAVLVQSSYPEFAPILGTPDDIADFFNSIGNVASAEARNAIRDNLDKVRDDFSPANPSLCATNEEIEQFCSVRQRILEGRCTPDEIASLCENVRNGDALDDLANIAFQGVPEMLAAGLPPIVSDPGCDDGLLPREPDEMRDAAAASLSNALEQLKVDFTMDMIGNGPFRKNWGMINLMLSDTDADPLTTHIRQTNRNTLFFKKKNVDFYIDPGGDEGQLDDDTNYARLDKQHGAYPKYVGEWLFSSELKSSYDTNSSVSFSNDFSESDVVFRGDYRGNFDILSQYSYGYNYRYKVDYADNSFKVIKRPRKSSPDVQMYFQDNMQGDGDGTDFAYGFNMNVFFHDIEASGSEYVNTRHDTTRVSLIQLLNDIDYTALDKEERKKKKKNDDEAAKTEKRNDGPVKDKKYEFLTIDDTFKDLDESLTDFRDHFVQHKSQIPQITALEELTGISISKSEYERITGQMLTELKDQILSEENPSFEYGAQYAALSTGEDFSDVDYGIVQDGEFILYSDYASENDISNEDQILGISYMQYRYREEPKRNRVHYLDPNLYGGSFLNPKVYIEPPKNKGWLGLIDAMFPEISPCKPYRVEIVDFNEIQQKINQEYSTTPDDKRLLSDPDCVIEKPFNRILERTSKTGIAMTIRAICKIYASAHIIKTLPVFGKIKPDLSKNFSDIYAQYIVEEMAENFKEAQGDAGELFSTFKDSEFWYSFLEQTVQYYSDLVNSGKITNPPQHIIDILVELNDLQETYDYPQKEDLRGEEGRDTSLGIRLGRSRLREYRLRKNLEAVQTVEEQCKIVLKEIVKEETQNMANIFVENAARVDLIDPDNYIHDMRFYFLQEVCSGNSLDLQKEIKTEITGFNELTGSGKYTEGGVFSIASTGEDYVGYYHSHEDDEGNLIFMVGEEHSDEAHDALLPIADIQFINIGDVQDFDQATTTADFQVVKYLKVDNVKRPTTDIFDVIDDSENPAQFISDVYPGSLRIVESTIPSPISDVGEVRQVGLDGELGLRYGLMLLHKGQEVTSVEVDLLDLPIGEAQPMTLESGDLSPVGSKILFCLINKMIDDPKFKLITEYIFPMKKMASLVAIYTDFAIFPSIGEVTAEDKDNPGLKLEFTDEGETEGTGDEETELEVSAPQLSYTPGWRKISKRKKGQAFTMKWDEWDRQILRKSTHRAKKMFKEYYELRDFKPGQFGDEKPGQQFLNELREAIKPAPGQRLLPWFRKRSGNPLNAKNKVCKNKG